MPRCPDLIANDYRLMKNSTRKAQANGEKKLSAKDIRKATMVFTLGSSQSCTNIGQGYPPTL